MPASEQGLLERTMVWAGAGGAVGGMIGVVTAGFTRPAVGQPAIAFVAKTSATSAGELAGIAAIFAVSDSILTSTRGHSPANGALAGCLAGSLLGLRAGSVTNAFYGCGAFALLQVTPAARTLSLTLSSPLY